MSYWWPVVPGQPVVLRGGCSETDFVIPLGVEGVALSYLAQTFWGRVTP